MSTANSSNFVGHAHVIAALDHHRKFARQLQVRVMDLEHKLQQAHVYTKDVKQQHHVINKSLIQERLKMQAALTDSSKQVRRLLDDKERSLTEIASLKATIASLEAHIIVISAGAAPLLHDFSSMTLNCSDARVSCTAAETEEDCTKETKPGQEPRRRSVSVPSKGLRGDGLFPATPIRAPQPQASSRPAQDKPAPVATAKSEAIMTTPRVRTPLSSTEGGTPSHTIGENVDTEPRATQADANAIFSRPRRRSLTNKSYKEPNLRDKMRREA